LKGLCEVLGLDPAAGLKYALHRLGRLRGAAPGGEISRAVSQEFPAMEAFLRKNFPLQPC
jgi:hypothetical protein